jgi:hypothetical protein
MAKANIAVSVTQLTLDYRYSWRARQDSRLDLTINVSGNRNSEGSTQGVLFLSDPQTDLTLAEISRSAHSLIQLYALSWMEPNNPKKFVAIGGSATANATTMVLLHEALVLLGQFTLGFDIGIHNWL